MQLLGIIFWIKQTKGWNKSYQKHKLDVTIPILGGVFYVRWLGGVVQNYPKSLNKGNKLISHKTFQNTSSL